MILQDLVAGKSNGEVSVEGFKLAVPALKRLIDEGYENILVYKESRTFALWGKSCSACLSEEDLRSLA